MRHTVAAHASFLNGPRVGREIVALLPFPSVPSHVLYGCLPWDQHHRYAYKFVRNGCLPSDGLLRQKPASLSYPHSLHPHRSDPYGCRPCGRYHDYLYQYVRNGCLPSDVFRHMSTTPILSAPPTSPFICPVRLSAVGSLIFSPFAHPTFSSIRVVSIRLSTVNKNKYVKRVRGV